MPEVARVVTPISLADAAAHLLAALRAAGEEPNQDEAQLLLGQLWLETARGTACDNRNIGNITAGPKWTGDLFRPAWFTVDDHSSPRMLELHEAMQKGQAPSAFRSYADFEHGFGDYVAQLLHTFPSIVTAARGGDAGDVARAIKSSGYAPDAQPGTDHSLDSLRREFRSKGVFAELPLAVAPEAPPPSSHC